MTTICADDAEITALQSFMSACGVNTSGVAINSSCSMGVEGFVAGGVGVYPNPTTGKVFIDGIGLYQSVSVYNCLGQEVVRSFVSQDDKMIVDLGVLPSEIYFVKVVGILRSGKCAGL